MPDPSHTVLVVEDDPFVRAEAVELFRELGCRVLDTYHAEGALALLDQNPVIDILFTDVRMPGMDGLSLAQQVRRRRPDIMVVLTSAYTPPIAIEPPMTFLPKPWRRPDLAALLEWRRDARE